MDVDGQSANQRETTKFQIHYGRAQVGTNEGDTRVVNTFNVSPRILGKVQ